MLGCCLPPLGGHGLQLLGTGILHVYRVGSGQYSTPLYLGGLPRGPLLHPHHLLGSFLLLQLQGLQPALRQFQCCTQSHGLLV